MQILRLHQQIKYNHILRKAMFSKTEFNPSTSSSIQFPNGIPSLRKKSRFRNSGSRKSASRSNWSSPKICRPTLSTMGHLLPLELHTTDTFVLEPSRMWFAGMHPRQGTLFLEGSAGTAMGCPSNTKLIRLWESQTKDKSQKWELPNTTKNADPLSWGTRLNGNKLLIGLEDGLISKMITRPLIEISWSQSGMSSRPSLIRIWYIEGEKLCLIPMASIPSCPILKFNSTIKMLMILLFGSASLWWKTPM